MTVDDPIIFSDQAPPQTPPQSDQGQSDHEQLRSRLMAQFERWLDQMLAEQPPPQGLPQSLLEQAMTEVTDPQAARDTDMYTLFSSLTALTGEIRLQGRAFKQLSDLLSPLSQTPAMLAQLQEDHAASIRLLQSAIENGPRRDGPPFDFKQLCEVMIDLHDRFCRGLQTCDHGIAALQARPRASWLGRLLHRRDEREETALNVQAIRDAAGLTLARLTAAMQEWGIQRIGRAGEPFDPDRMSAVEVRVDSESDPGTVLEINRSGYAINGVVKSPAQVTVSKPGI